MKTLFFKNSEQIQEYANKMDNLGFVVISEEQDCNCGESEGYSVIGPAESSQIESLCLCTFCYENCLPEERGNLND